MTARSRSRPAAGARHGSPTVCSSGCATTRRSAATASSPPRSPAAALDLLEVDHLGLDRLDREILRTICDKFAGGPVGLSTLAAAVGEEQDTIEDVYEPYLLQRGLIERTPRGRAATRRAFDAPGTRAARAARAADAAVTPQRLSREGHLRKLFDSARLSSAASCRTSTTSSARTAGTVRWDRPATPASGARPAAARSAGSRYLFELLDDYYPAPNAAFFACDADGRIVDCGRGSFELTGLKTEPAIGRPVGEALGLHFEDGADHVATALEWEVRVRGKPVELSAGPRAGARGRRHLPRLRR